MRYNYNMPKCRNCNKLNARKSYIYCSNQCQRDYECTSWLVKWAKGEVDGGRGINTRNVSGYLARYLFEKYKQACSICGWNQVHPVTNRVPLEIDHIDGNAENNIESNLRVVCPNCHSLTSSFRNLNKGTGREWRRLKYIKSV